MNSDSGKPKTELNKAKALVGAAGAVALTVFGASLNEWIARPKPEIIINSIGFSGPLQDQRIQITDDLIALSTDSQWIDSLQRFETFDKLVNTEKEVSETIERLDQAMASIRAWDSQNPRASADQAIGAVAANLIKQHPLIKDETLTLSVLSLIRRQSLVAVPIEERVLLKSFTIFDVYNRDIENRQLIVIDLGERRINIDTTGQSTRKRENLNLFAQSIARASMKNVGFYSERAMHECQEGILQLQDLQGKLRSFLLPRAGLTATVTIHNGGKSSVTIRPFFSIRIAHKDYLGKFYTMAAEMSRPLEGASYPLTPDGEVSISLRSGAKEGKKVHAQPYLSKSSSARYISLAPGESRELVLVALDALSTDAEKIKTLHATRLLNCQITGLTATGKPIVSAIAEFSENAGTEDRERLDEIQRALPVEN